MTITQQTSRYSIRHETVGANAPETSLTGDLMKGLPNHSRHGDSETIHRGLKPTWLELEYVDERTAGTASWIVVTLNCNGRLVTGMSPAIEHRNTRHGIHRSALATLNALEQFSDHVLSCELLDIACTASRAQATIVVRLRVHSGRESSELFGSAIVKDDFAKAAARAVLDAANLYVHSLLVAA